MEADYASLIRPTRYRVMREFCDDPKGFVEAAIEE
jgi:hypothetical protein